MCSAPKYASKKQILSAPRLDCFTEEARYRCCCTLQDFQRISSKEAKLTFRLQHKSEDCMKVSSNNEAEILPVDLF